MPLFRRGRSRWLSEKHRTFAELSAEEIDRLRWMAANAHDKDVLDKLAVDPNVLV